MLTVNTPLSGKSKSWSRCTYNPVFIRIILLHFIQMLLSGFPIFFFLCFFLLCFFFSSWHFFLTLSCFCITPSTHLTPASASFYLKHIEQKTKGISTILSEAGKIIYKRVVQFKLADSVHRTSRLR